MIHVSTFPVSRRFQIPWKRKLCLEVRRNAWSIKKNHVSSFHGNVNPKKVFLEKSDLLRAAETLTFLCVKITFPVSTFPLYYVENGSWEQPSLRKIKM